jgi:hypothetical protein
MSEERLGREGGPGRGEGILLQGGFPFGCSSLKI